MTDIPQSHPYLPDYPPPPQAVQLTAEAELLALFDYAHLPAHLQDVSREFHDLAYKVARLPGGGQKLFCLQQLLIAKDAAVRAAVVRA